MMSRKTAILAAGGLLMGMTGAAGGETLSDLRWEQRVLVVFAPEGDGRLGDQARALLADEAALTTRDMLVLAVEGERVRPVFGAAPGGESAASLRERLRAPEEDAFTAVLVGKDGGVKWRGDAPIALDALTALVDAMPMRRAGQR